MKYLYLLIAFFCVLGCNTKKGIDLKLIPMKSGEYWGYVNHEGKFKIQPQFKYAFIFSSGLALVKNSDNKYGYINEKGDYVIEPKYKNGLGFSEGLALVVQENSQLSYIDLKGNLKITLGREVESAYSFTEGLSPIYSNGFYGYVDETGRIAIPCKFPTAFPFKEGLAKVSVYDSTDRCYKYGFINTKGEIVISYQFRDADNFSDGLALVYNGKQYGYIDKKGKYLINPQFDLATNFDGDYAVIKLGELYGYINKEGKTVINPQYKSADKFYENAVAVVKSADGKYGYIDKNGKYSINPQFDYVSRFYGDLAILSMANKVGVINNKGKITINPQFDDVSLTKDNDQWIYSDYFDLIGTVNYILNSFSGFAANTTFKMLEAKFSTINKDNYNDFTDFSTGENRFVKLKRLRFNFINGIFNYADNYTTQQVYDPIAGGYTTQKVYNGTSSTINENAVISDVQLTFSLYSKADGQEKKIMAEIANKLNKEYGLQYAYDDLTGQTTKLQNESYSITIDTHASVGYDLRIYVSFIEKGTINNSPSASTDTTAISYQ